LVLGLLLGTESQLRRFGCERLEWQRSAKPQPRVGVENLGTQRLGGTIMRFLTYLGLLSATLLWLGILWIFAHEPSDLGDRDVGAFAT
jgi:hypothetical protein